MLSTGNKDLLLLKDELRGEEVKLILSRHVSAAPKLVHLGIYHLVENTT